MSEEMTECPLCRRPAAITSAANLLSVECSYCGPFRLTADSGVEIAGLDPSALVALSAAVRQAAERHDPLSLTAANWREHFAAHHRTSIASKLHKIILVAAQRSAHFGALFMVQPEEEYLLFDAVNAVEAWALVQQLQDEAILTRDTTEQIYAGSLTRKGWNLAEAELIDQPAIPPRPLQMDAPNSARRSFRVAFSFPGEARFRIEPIAQAVAALLSHGDVFYDDWYKGDLARPNLDLYLQAIYAEQSALVVVCLCADYQRKDWCGLEWRAIRALIMRRQDNIMFLRLDDAVVDGTFSIDGYIDLRTHPNDEVAQLIAERAGIPAAPRKTPNGVTAGFTAQVPQPPDLTIEIIDTSVHGLAVRLRNDDLAPIEHCQVVMQRLDKFLPQKHEFTRNPFEPIVVLNVNHLGGGETSTGFVFAVWDTSVRSISFKNDIPERRTAPYPELTGEGTWIAEFALRHQGTTLRTSSCYIQWTPGNKPQLIADPRPPSPIPVTQTDSRFIHLLSRNVRITPVLPLQSAHDAYLVQQISGDVLELVQTGTGDLVRLPMSYVRRELPSPGELATATLELEGRLQWLSLSRMWRLFPEKPTTLQERQYGFARAAASDDDVIRMLEGRGQTVRFASEGNIPRYASQGYQIVYDDLGFYLRRGDAILLAQGR